MADSVLLAVNDGIARVTLARPEVRNAFNAEVIEQLHEVFTRITAADDVRAVVLAGEGKVFCGGADINWMRASLDLNFDANVGDAERMSDMYRAIDNCPKPVIGRIHGAALGGGAGLAAVCDIAIASDDAIFGFTEVKLGIIPAVISPFVLAKIGASHARALFLTGERFDAHHAEAIALVHQVVPFADLDEAVEGKFSELHTAGPSAIAAAKLLARRVLDNSYADSRAITTKAIAKQRVSPEGQEGLRAFLERRPAKIQRNVIERLLVANRGEIAVRVARAAREMGIVPLGIYSEADANAYHLRFVEDARCVGPAAAVDSYLNAEAIVAAAVTMKADALHPGYGFLSERAPFAQAVRDAGIIFVGPTPEAMAAMGSKIEAKRRVRAFGVPTVPGYDGDDQSEKTLRSEAHRIGFPLLIKASAGGGGRGMRVVNSAPEFGQALESAKREARAAFGDDTVLLERYLRDPRHIEFQILADEHGTTIHLGERECSIQRRHQKIVEEAPSVALTPALRAEMGAAAVRAAESAGYTNAGTVEFMLDGDGAYYFLEMNARLQVEHPVTELVYGIDLVQCQLRIAAGEPLNIAQSDVRPRGWSIEARIYAEDPANEMLPSTGTISHWQPPEGPGVRLDAGVTHGSAISHYYDPMLAKLIVFGSDRDAAIARLKRSLQDFVIGGVRTNVPLLLWIARDDAFARGETTTAFLDRRLDESIFRSSAPEGATLLAAAALLVDGRAPWRIGQVGVPIRLEHAGGSIGLLADAQGEASRWQLSGTHNGELRAARYGDAIRADFDGTSFSGAVTYDVEGISVLVDGRSWRFEIAPPPSLNSAAVAHGARSEAHVTAPMPGRIVKIAVSDGDNVAEHALLVVLEAMKMEHRIEASSAATVKSVLVKEGQIVAGGTPLVELGS